MSELEALKFRLSELELEQESITDQLVALTAAIDALERRDDEVSNKIWDLEDEIAELEAGS